MNTDAFIPLLLGFDPNAASTPADQGDGTENIVIDGDGQTGETGAAEEPAQPAWYDVLPADTEADETDLIAYKSGDDIRELEVRIYGSDVYLIYDNAGSITCTLAGYNADTYRYALDEFIRTNSESALPQDYNEIY